MNNSNQYPTTQNIVYLLGMGILLTGMIAFPGLGFVAKTIIDAKEEREQKEQQKYWKKFNVYLLRRNIKRLQQQKIVEVMLQDGQEVVKLTSKGQTKYLKFKLEKLSLKGGSWDGRWRLVIYDVSKLKRLQQEQFRRILKQIKFLQLQKSVYLTPFPCREEVEYLRQYFGLSEEVLILEVCKLENDQNYRQYFGI